jgi:hypothetical protein
MKQHLSYWLGAYLLVGTVLLCSIGAAMYASTIDATPLGGSGTALPTMVQETSLPIFDTTDGQIHPGEYALIEDGKNFLVYNSTSTSGKTYEETRKTPLVGGKLIHLVNHSFVKFLNDGSTTTIPKATYDADTGATSLP